MGGYRDAVKGGLGRLKTESEIQLDVGFDAAKSQTRCALIRGRLSAYSPRQRKHMKGAVCMMFEPCCN